MKRIFSPALTVSLCVLFSPLAHSQEYSVLHNFAGVASGDGAWPYCGLILSGDMLYGTTAFSGAHNAGAIFSIKTDGSNYQVLYSFGGPPDGETPVCGLVKYGNKLYGTTYGGGSEGGAGGDGTIFSFDISDSTLTLLYEFGAAANDGKYPRCTLLLIDGILYGTTREGGTANCGTIFSYNLGASTYSKMYDFLGSPDGAVPAEGLITDGTLLYGLTVNGGAHGTAPGNGTVYCYDPASGACAKIHDFGDSPSDGHEPYGLLLLDGGTLYGTTTIGGEGWNGGSYNGTVFRIDTDGGNYQLLHSFVSCPYDGSTPRSGLVVRDGTLYGVATAGGIQGEGAGATGWGVIYSIGTDGSNFAIERDFEGPPSDGSYPMCTLLLDRRTFYGTTLQGGNTGIGEGLGTIFSYSLEPPLIALNVNKTTFSTTDRLVVTADVKSTATSFYPYIRVTLPGGSSLYYVRGSGFYATQRSYLHGGPYTVRTAINDYGVLDLGFTGMRAGTYILEGWGVDVFGNVLDEVDSYTLTIQ